MTNNIKNIEMKKIIFSLLIMVTLSSCGGGDKKEKIGET